MTTNMLEMGSLISLLTNESSPWQLLWLISGSIPNIHSKSPGGVQHNGTFHHVHICDNLLVFLSHLACLRTKLTLITYTYAILSQISTSSLLAVPTSPTPSIQAHSSSRTSPRSKAHALQEGLCHQEVESKVVPDCTASDSIEDVFFLAFHKVQCASLLPASLPISTGHVFYQLILTAYSSSTKAGSILNYTPLCATPLHACFHLNFSYHIMVASTQPNESEDNIIISTIKSIVIHSNHSNIRSWKLAAKTVALQLGAAGTPTSS